MLSCWNGVTNHHTDVGVCGLVLKWLASFDHGQKSGSRKEGITPSPSGCRVPQGAILSPLLFNISICALSLSWCGVPGWRHPADLLIDLDADPEITACLELSGKEIYRYLTDGTYPTSALPAAVAPSWVLDLCQGSSFDVQSLKIVCDQHT